MKIVTVISALALTAALPSAAFAQLATTTQTIVVSGKYQRDWQKGSRMESQGLKELEEAQKANVTASADVVNAQNKTSSSQERSANASAEFVRLTSSTQTFASGKDALDWAKRVNRAADNWARFEKRGDTGAKDMDKAMRDQRKAQQAIEKAQVKVDRGRSMKADAERLSNAGG